MSHSLNLVAGLLASGQVTPSLSAGADAPAKGSLPADLDLVPRTAIGFSSVRIADLLSSDLLKGLLPELLKLEDSPLPEVEKALGMPLTNLERGTFVVWAPDPENAMAIITRAAGSQFDAELARKFVDLVRQLI